MQFSHQKGNFSSLNLRFVYFVRSEMSKKVIITFPVMNNTRLERNILIILDFENGFLPTYLPLWNLTLFDVFDRFQINGAQLFKYGPYSCPSKLYYLLPIPMILQPMTWPNFGRSTRPRPFETQKSGLDCTPWEIDVVRNGKHK